MDEKPTSSWDDLINQIGAKPAPDALERRRPAIETHFDPPAAAGKPAAKPKSKPGNWSALADELGVEVPAEDAEPPAESGDRAVVDLSAMEASFATIQPIESEFEDVVEEEIAEVEFAETDAETDDIIFEDEDSDLSDIDDEEVGDDDLPPSTLSGEAARSAFEALFQAGAGGAARQPPPPRPRERREPRPPVDDIYGDDEPLPRPERSPRSTPSPTPAARDRDDGGEQPAEGDGEGERRPRRRRRRGGRGRGREREGVAQPAASGEQPRRDDESRREDSDLEDDLWQSEGGEQPTNLAADHGDEDSDVGRREERPAPRRSRRGRGPRGASGEDRKSVAASDAKLPARNGRTAPPALDDDDSSDAADELGDLPIDEGDDESGGSRAAHKSIPSWSEAIEVMVEVNMQGRKNAPQRPSSPRGGGRGRGRGRGGRGGRSGDRTS